MSGLFSFVQRLFFSLNYDFDDLMKTMIRHIGQVSILEG